MKSIQRTFIPGSRWIYFKLYTGTKTSDKILGSNISSILRKLNNNGLIKKWFFIRYADPDFHLRIRILVNNESHIGEVIHLFYERLRSPIQNSLIWKIQIDTYNRELERYGNKLIEIAESVFFYDSECSLFIIKKIVNENHRWMIALKMIDSLLDDFSFDIVKKQMIMEQVSNSFKDEFGFNQYNSKQFNIMYREKKKIIESVLNDTITDINFKSLYSPIRKRSKRLIPIIKELNSNSRVNKKELTISYIHMMLNRLFLSKNRLHELVLYDFMKRYYASEIAKSKYMVK